MQFQLSSLISIYICVWASQSIFVLYEIQGDVHEPIINVNACI